MGEREFSRLQFETGFRVEGVEHEPDNAKNEDFTLLSASAGLVIPFADGWEAGIQTDYSERAPSPEELYSNGAHLATQSFELGDPNLREERAINFALTLDYDGGRWRVNGAAYYTSFSNYIYESYTGLEDVESGLPILQFTQNDADYYGVEFGGGLRLARYEAGELWLTGMFDYVDAKLDVSGNDNVPRLVPGRIGIGAEATWDIFSANIDYLYAYKQDDVPEFALETDSYDDLRIFIGATMPFGDSQFEVFVQGKNLTDSDQRYSASFIKDFAPQPGRSVEGGVRVLF